ncbi:RES family NAD+ phosphorylase [Rhizosaccharibacter radicis]|uniref:RES family NAD+ phosphorylase n=1 Tax=Rhizosaccharibacter radicis TaxID=2782605 RepID=A0ABT1VZY0_9PROT|nr:RES family NAD+ phosphorylase [Acetobacteraceae bacterium KSS12]
MTDHAELPGREAVLPEEDGGQDLSFRAEPPARPWTPPVSDIVQRNTVRLIPSGRLKPPVLAPLAPTKQAMEDLAALEGLTNGRLMAAEDGLPELNPRELAFGRPNDSFVNAAFTHVRAGGNRFNDEKRGAWYCGFDAETSLGEVAFHLTRELEAIDRFENVSDYAELVADFIGPFHDLRGAGPWASACLAADTALAYPAGQRLARRLREDALSNGLIYPSVRWPEGTCLVAFRPALVQNLRQGGLWRLRWEGRPEPVVERLGSADTL